MPFLHTFYRQFILVCGLVLLCIISKAQKEDYVWLSGYRSSGGFAGYDSLTHGVFGTCILDFNDTPRSVTYDSLHMNFDRTNMTISNGSGQLLFYSNGVYIANALDEKIKNADSLAIGYYINNFDPSMWEFGYYVAKGIISLNYPQHLNNYIILETFIDTIPGLAHQITPLSVYSTLLDMNANLGMGEVLYKNIPIFRNYCSSGISAIRHGNGRDWWAISQKQGTNCYYKILIDPTGARLYDSTCIGPNIYYDNITRHTFSNDGNKFAQISYGEGLVIFDFDRCNGSLSNSKYIPNTLLSDSGWISLGIAFSPNDRFLYVSLTKIVLQYDLSLPNWTNLPPDTVAIFDGYRSPFGSYFDVSQIGPDGKIYIGCGNGEDVYHVINRPNEKGDSCLFTQHGLQMPTYSGGVPNYPNYRLGALAGSACDTITTLSPTLSQRERELKVFPNPATDAVTVDYGFTNWEKGDVDLEITNAAGQLVHSQHLPMYSGFQRLDVMQYAAGVYNVAIKRGNAVVSVSQFVKQ